jgi:hypothetical protein
MPGAPVGAIRLKSIKVMCAPLLLSLLLAGCGGADSSAASTSGTTPPTAGETSPPPLSSGPPPVTPPTPTTGAATVSWVAPTQNSDGSPLTSLAGYTIYYGTSAASLTQTIKVASAGASSYVVTNLSSGTWYFAVAAYTNAGVQSNQSNVSSKTI